MEENIPETGGDRDAAPTPETDENTLMLQSLLPDGKQERKRIMTALLRGLLNESQSES